MENNNRQEYFMMRNIIIVSVLTALTGCVIEKADSIGNYKCSNEQLEMVAKEMAICRKGYLESYCFLSAKAVYCNDIRSGADNGEG